MPSDALCRESLLVGPRLGFCSSSSGSDQTDQGWGGGREVTPAELPAQFASCTAPGAGSRGQMSPACATLALPLRDWEHVRAGRVNCG